MNLWVSFPLCPLAPQHTPPTAIRKWHGCPFLALWKVLCMPPPPTPRCLTFKQTLNNRSPASKGPFMLEFLRSRSQASLQPHLTWETPELTHLSNWCFFPFSSVGGLELTVQTRLAWSSWSFTCLCHTSVRANIVLFQCPSSPETRTKQRRSTNVGLAELVKVHGS